MDTLSAFEHVNSASELAAVLSEQRAEVATRASSLGGLELMAAYSDLTDALVRRVFDLAGGASGIAIAAVGGYGRREMSPFSDVDVAFIVIDGEDEEIDVTIKRAFRILMDVVEIARLKVGYSYRRMDDVASLPLETQTALLDARCVAGSETAFNAFHRALLGAIVPAAFVMGHVDGRRDSDSTPLVVEPDVKEGSGGLRDLHAARWIAQVTFGLRQTDRQAPTAEGVWEGLRARGILLDDEIAELVEAAEFISKVRNALHLAAGRGQDVLAAERHGEIARALGFDGPKELMSRYHSHARELSRICRKIASACLEEELEIEPGVVARGGKLCIKDKGLLARDDAAILRTFLHTQSFHLEIDREAGDLIRTAVRGWKPGPEANLTFRDILSHTGASAALRSMADLGVLQGIVPGFGDLMGLIPGDAAHEFTVGEHSLRACEHLEKLLADGGDQFADICSRLQNFEVIFLAALLHDIGKLDSGRDHAKSGALRAAKFARQLGMSEDEAGKIEFLVRRHLKMAETARLRDLNRPKTVRDFTVVIGDLLLLDMLLLLTVADYQSVGAKHWSQVQIRFLLELHERAAAALRSPGAAGPDIDRHRSRVRRELCLANLPQDEVNEHTDSMPAGYLLNTPPEELAAHIGYASRVRSGTPVVEMKDDRTGEFTILTVAAMDRRGLLSEIAGALHAMSVDIHAAQIFTRHSSDHIAIDILYVDFEGRQLAEMKKRQVEGELLNVLAGRQSVDDLLRRWGREKFAPKGEIRVSVLENLSDHETVIEVRTIDALGLLYRLTSRIAELGWNIHSARVATWGHEARDAFYVTGQDGEKLDASDVVALIPSSRAVI